MYIIIYIDVITLHLSCIDVITLHLYMNFIAQYIYLFVVKVNFLYLNTMQNLIYFFPVPNCKTQNN